MERQSDEQAMAESLRESEHRFRVLIEGMAMSAWEVDPSGTVNIIRLAGWSATEGQTFEAHRRTALLEIVHPDDRDQTQQRWDDCARSKCVFNAEFRIKGADGNWCWTQAYAAPMLGADGEVVKWIGMNVDITDRKQAEEQLIKSERQMQLALDISRISFWSFNPPAGVVRMDARMRTMWGESGRDELLPIDTVYARIHPDDRPIVQQSVEDAIDPNGTGIFLPTDYRLVLDDGSIRWLAANGMTMFSGRGNERRATELFGTVLDITERKAIEDSLRESEERLQQLNAELEDRVRERTQDLMESEDRLREAVKLAEQSSRQLRRLALELSRTEERERRRLAQILHDHLQQLLIAAKMRVESLAQDGAMQDAQERLVGIATVIDVAIDATRTLAVELVPPVLHTQGLPAALQWLATHMHEQHGLLIDVTVDTAANPISEEARDLLFQAAREFLLNVVKHAFVAEAKLSLALEDGQVVMEVSDRGVGFTPALAGENNTTFGLFHLRERLTALGGDLLIESHPQNGTRVIVRLTR
jgi:PAS domain S-box-containing protein